MALRVVCGAGCDACFAELLSACFKHKLKMKEGAELSCALGIKPIARASIALGACALSGGLFEERGIKADVKVPGCPPSPEAIWQAVKQAMGKVSKQVELLKYEEAKCIGCKFCIKFCPTHAISIEPFKVEWERCIACFVCVMICPSGALSSGCED